MSNPRNPIVDALRSLLGEKTWADSKRLVGAILVVIAVLLVGAIGLLATTLVWKASEVSPFGLWGVAVVALLALVLGILYWFSVASKSRASTDLTRSQLPADFSQPGSLSDLAIIPPAAVVASPAASDEQAPSPGGLSERLSFQMGIDALIAAGAYDHALELLDQDQQSCTDPTAVQYARLKRAAIERKRRQR